MNAWKVASELHILKNMMFGLNSPGGGGKGGLPSLFRFHEDVVISPLYVEFGKN